MAVSIDATGSEFEPDGVAVTVMVEMTELMTVVKVVPLDCGVKEAELED